MKIAPPRIARWSVLFISACSMLLAGCGRSGPPTGTVQGKVLFNDAPYADAAVVFLSLTTGAAGSADIQADGTFQLKEPLRVGEYRVFLSPKVAATAEPTPVRIDRAVPEKYWNETTTDVSLQVKEGKNEFTVPLKK